jgi:molybdate transport system substrate-binding protein
MTTRQRPRVLELLSAGAAKGVVQALESAFGVEVGVALHATFGAVGAIHEAFDHGAACDAIVLTAAMIGALADEGRVRRDTIAPLGRVRTGVAVADGEPLPAIADPMQLSASLRAASAIYFPDPERATAGMHFVKVLRTLGVYDEVTPRLRPYPNGAAAMQALADAHLSGALGCTQVTEIRYTRGVTLVGVLPPEFELATVYAAAVARDTRSPDDARRFVEWLTGPRSRALRSDGGFGVL